MYSKLRHTTNAVRPRVSRIRTAVVISQKLTVQASRPGQPLTRHQSRSNPSKASRPEQTYVITDRMLGQPDVGQVLDDMARFSRLMRRPENVAPDMRLEGSICTAIKEKGSARNWIEVDALRKECTYNSLEASPVVLVRFHHGQTSCPISWQFVS